MNLVKNKLQFLLLVIALCCQHCTYRNVEDIHPNNVCTQTLPDTVSFSRDIQPILTNNCSLSGCHSGNNPEGNFNLEAGKSYAELMQHGSGYVDTINPRYSVVYSELVSQSNPMPPMGRLDQCSIDLIEKWMKQKAKNN
ncbi:MAG TPA: hypothetical protein VNB90_04300 [Cytophagaceae bacterium]|jgi:hypothetical protein|nr:hypothetical protein [Cytophagaceae bacterium]